MISENCYKNKEIIDLPEIGKLNFKPIPRAYLKVVLISTALTFLVLFGILFVLVFFELAIINTYGNYFYAFLFLLFISIEILNILGFKYRKYLIRKLDVSYRSGLIVNTITTVPFSRIQHVEIEKGPISKLFNLTSLAIYTAGDSSKDLTIKGLREGEALQIKEFIIKSING